MKEFETTQSAMILAWLDIRTQAIEALSDRMDRPRIKDPSAWPTAEMIISELDYSCADTDGALEWLISRGYALESEGRFCITRKGEHHLIGAAR